MHALKADTHRAFGRFSWWLVFKGVMLLPGFRVLVTLRCCQQAESLPPITRRLFFIPSRIMHGFASHLAGVELPWRTKVAPGLALTHARGIVVNSGSSIGRNVTLFHGVTLGQNDQLLSDGSRLSRCPVIEDDVWIGPNAIVVGGVTVGAGSRIAGGAFVFKDIPSRCLVVGNPAQIVKTNCEPDVGNRVEY
jgi:serine O-acetyltransferase